MKWLIRGGLVLLVLIVVAVAIVVMTINSLARTGITSATTYATGCNTTLDGARIGVLSGEASISGLTINNPEGFQSERFLELGQGDVAVTLGSLMSDEVEVGLISLDSLHMTLESKEGKNNYDIILENLQKLSGEEEEEPAPAEGGKKYAVREIVLKNIKVDAEIYSLGGESKKIPIEIPEIRMTDVGTDSDKGVLLADVMGMIIAAVFKSVAANAGDLLPDAMIGGLRDGLAGLGDLGNVSVEVIGDVSARAGEVTEQVGAAVEEAGAQAEELGKAAGQAGEAAEDAGKAVEDAGKKIEEGLDGLLGGKKEEPEAKE